MTQDRKYYRKQNHHRSHHHNHSHNHSHNSEADIFVNGKKINKNTALNKRNKYLDKAKDASSEGDKVSAENYLQHAEYYNKIILFFEERVK